MSIIEDFAQNTIVPIEINSIVDYLLKKGFVGRITLHKEDVDPSDLAGFLLFREVKVPYGTLDVADITYSSRLPDDWTRLVLAKELVHIVDTAACKVSTKDAVSKLIDTMILPHAASLELAKVDNKYMSDKTGILTGLTLLAPMSARNKLKQLYDDGTLSISDISELLKVPRGYAHLVMLDYWPETVETIKKIYQL